MNTQIRRTIVVTFGTTLLLLTAPGVAAAKKAKPPKATTTIKCEQAASGGKPPYDGDSASSMYDRRFTPGPELTRKELSDHTPQGLAWWENWDGKGNDLLLVTTYGKDKAHIVGLDPRSDASTVGTVDIEPKQGDKKQTHAGGIAVNDRWVFVAGPDSGGWDTIRRYRLSDVKDAMTTNGSVRPDGEDRKVYGASTMTIDGEHLYAGKFNSDRRDWMYSYTIEDNGELSLDEKEDGDGLRWEIPRSTQGVAVADGRFLFSSSNGRPQRSNVYVTDKGETNLDKASARCFRAPSMSQGVAVTPNGETYLLFESGSFQYNGASGDPAINVVRGVHRAETSRLTSLPGGSIRLGTLHCAAQEDIFGNDDITIKVEDQTLKSVEISDGQRKPIDKTVQFTGRASVKLYEDDVEGDDFLGEKVLEPGAKDGVRKFANDATYRLSLTIA
jgi:hypothetical protein